MAVTVQLYEYAVILQPKTNSKGEVTEKEELVVEPTRVLARREEDAALLAGRSIPEQYLDRLDRLSIVVRPF